jgi:hypothetical protein
MATQTAFVEAIDDTIPSAQDAAIFARVLFAGRKYKLVSSEEHDGSRVLTLDIKGKRRTIELRQVVRDGRREIYQILAAEYRVGFWGRVRGWFR